MLSKSDIVLSGSARKAFTLIEVLVAVTVIGIIAGLLLVAVQGAQRRHAELLARITFVRLGIALETYAATTFSFPHINNGRKGYSIHSMILPNLGMRNIYNGINFDLKHIEKANKTISNILISEFLCPSDHVNGKGAWTNYACSVGYAYQTFGWNGVFVMRPAPPTSPASIYDGASYTVMGAEWVLGNPRVSPSDRKIYIYSTYNRRTKPNEFDEFISECVDVIRTSPKPVLRDKGKGWISSDHGKTIYNHSNSINGFSCLNKGFVFEGAFSAGSRHPGGCHALFADGHVQFLKETIAIDVWRAVSTRAGGEVVGNDL